MPYGKNICKGQNFPFGKHTIFIIVLYNIHKYAKTQKSGCKKRNAFSHAFGGHVIKASSLTKYYGSFCAVKDLSFTIEQGHIYGFLGPNGAGKTTTMNMLTGNLAATSGSVVIAGADIFKNPEEAKRHIGYLPEHPPLYPEFTPYEYLCFVGEAKGLRGAKLQNEVNGALKETGLTDVSARLIKNLSKGYCQRVGIAQATIGSPDVIILDEPTVGLDPKQVIQVRELIKSLSKKGTVILSSHILSEVEELCDRIMIMTKGTLVASDTLERLQKQYADNNILTLTVKCGVERAGEILSFLRGNAEYKVSPGQKAGSDIVITCQKKKDPRESVFFAFAKAGIPIISMNYKIITLEDVFLKATENLPKDALPKDSTPSEEALDTFVPPIKEKKPKRLRKAEDDEDDGDDYRPLFG